MNLVTPKYLTLILCSIVLMLYSCKEFIEPDITDRQVQLKAPGNDYQSTSYTVGFWWEEVEDALQYRLQIVSPDFQQTGALLVDTLIKGNKFSVNLSPGDYSWHLRAENGSTQTAYSNPQSFKVLFSSVKQQKVQLKSPANNFLTNQSNLTLNWNSLYGATQYLLQIDTNNFADENKIVYSKLTPALQINFNLTKDQFYQWRVRAQNDTAQAQWSAINNFTYDHTPPAVVNPLSPANSSTVSSPVNMQWSSSAAATRYKLYLFKSDSTSLFNNNFPMLLNTTSYSFNQGVFGERYYWRISCLDAAGNESTLSTMRSFILQ